MNYVCNGMCWVHTSMYCVCTSMYLVCTCTYLFLPLYQCEHWALFHRISRSMVLCKHAGARCPATTSTSGHWQGWSQGDGSWLEMKCGLHLYEYVLVQANMYRVRTLYILVCTVFTRILQRMLFCIVCLWETILCVRDMYAVVLQH